MKRVLLFLFLTFSNILAAQNSLAKIEYSYAEEAFNKKEYSKAIQHIEEVKKLLGNTNARIIYLEILARSNNLPNYQAFNNSVRVNTNTSVGSNTQSIVPLETLSFINSNKEIMIKAYSNQLKELSKYGNQTEETSSLFINIINKLESGQDITQDDFQPSTYNNLNNTRTNDVLDMENSNSKINNWLEGVDLINSLCDVYLENFEDEVPLEKLKKIYEIKKQCKVFIPNKELIKQSWALLKEKEYENALIKFRELQISGIESSSVINEIQRMIQFEQLDDVAISNIESKMVFVKGDAKTNIPDLYVSKYELTKKEYIDILNPENSNYTECGDCPISLSRNKAERFITFLNERTGKKYRLPTKEEWYWFATGGEESTDEERGKNKDKTKNILNYAWCSSNSYGTRAGVGRLISNELGLFDIWGNVSELTTTNAVGGAYLTKKKKMVNGDSYINSFMWDNEEEEWSTMGVRLVMTVNK